MDIINGVMAKYYEMASYFVSAVIVITTPIVAKNILVNCHCGIMERLMGTFLPFKSFKDSLISATNILLLDAITFTIMIITVIIVIAIVIVVIIIIIATILKYCSFEEL